MSLPRAALSLLPAAALLLPGLARAEDFTGFYAGVNAGYAVDRDGDRNPASSFPSPAVAAPQDHNGLPPSAEDAARLMQRNAPGRGAAAPGR